MALGRARSNDRNFWPSIPRAGVPALATERGIITETPAILTYIAQAFPAAGLAPLADPFAFAQIQSFNSYLCSTVHVAHAHRMRGSRWSDDPAVIEALKIKVPTNMAACFELIEAQMFRGALGDGRDLFDRRPLPVHDRSWLESDGVDPARFPKVQDHSKRMLSALPWKRS